MTANPREWGHIFKLRTNSASHPQMVKIMKQKLTNINPIVEICNLLPIEHELLTTLHLEQLRLALIAGGIIPENIDETYKVIAEALTHIKLVEIIHKDNKTVSIKRTELAQRIINHYGNEIKK